MTCWIINVVNILIKFTAAYADPDVFTHQPGLISGAVLCWNNSSRKKIEHCIVLLYGCVLWRSYMCRDLHILFTTTLSGGTTRHYTACITNSMGLLLRLVAIWWFIKKKEFKWRKTLEMPRGTVAAWEWDTECVSWMWNHLRKWWYTFSLV